MLNHNIIARELGLADKTKSDVDLKVESTSSIDQLIEEANKLKDVIE
jgi:acetolactate synthase regulatory subunit